MSNCQAARTGLALVNLKDYRRLSFPVIEMLMMLVERVVGPRTVFKREVGDSPGGLSPDGSEVIEGAPLARPV